MKVGGIANLDMGVARPQHEAQKPPLKLSKKKLNAKKIVFYLAIGIVVFFMATIAWFSKDLPTPAKLAKLKAIESTKILDRNGNILYQTGDERRTVIDKNQIPIQAKQALIAAEDANFYKHGAVDYRGILRAALADTIHLKISQGGSTITQQFVKNALLTSRRTFTRKIKELILSLEIEQIYSKDDILAMYLNEIPYGGNIYGIQEASKTYFGKDPKDLNLSESATLAAIVRAPTYYSPYGTHTDALFTRKNYVLDRMVELGYAKKEDAEKAKSDAPNKDHPDFKKKQESISAPYFVMYVKQQLVDQYGEKLVDGGGLKVTTTLDPDKQKAAEEAIQNGVPKITRYGATNAALISLDATNGEVLAMVGGKDYFDVQHGGNVNVTDASRQPGSSFKPIVYATAFKNPRFSPSFTLFDLTTDFNGYVPHNYDGNTHGPVSMRTALANSLNIPAVKTLSLAGIDNALKTAKDLGITTLNTPERYGLSLVLGGGEVKPIEMAGAFAAFADNGNYHNPTSIMKVEDHTGKVLYKFEPKDNRFQAIDPQIAYEISNILDDDQARTMIFGHNNAMDFGDQHVGVKTGTTTNFHDAWTVGYSTKISTAVWVGNNDNAEMKSGADGSVVAAPIFHDYMARFLDDSDFPRPKEIQDLTVEKYSNKLPTQYSHQTVKDIFASWQVPTDKDNINVIVKINKVNGKRATDSTPPELIEERLYTNLHNEWGDKWKDYPNWEGPVRSWAEGAGMNLAPPSENDESYSSRPTISISSPGNSATVSGQINISVSVHSDNGVSNVTYYLSDANIGSSSSSPYDITFDTSKYPNGSYNLKAKLTDDNGVATDNSISISINNESAPTITNLSVSGITVNSANVSFNTNVNCNSTIAYGLSSGALTSTVASGTSTKNHNAALSGLQNGKTYYFKVTATSGSGSSTSYTGTFNTL